MRIEIGYYKSYIPVIKCFHNGFNIFIFYPILKKLYILIPFSLKVRKMDFIMQI